MFIIVSNFLGLPFMYSATEAGEHIAWWESTSDPAVTLTLAVMVVTSPIIMELR